MPIVFSKVHVVQFYSLGAIVYTIHHVDLCKCILWYSQNDEISQWPISQNISLLSDTWLYIFHYITVKTLYLCFWNVYHLLQAINKGVITKYLLWKYSFVSNTDEKLSKTRQIILLVFSGPTKFPIISYTPLLLSVHSPFLPNWLNSSSLRNFQPYQKCLLFFFSLYQDSHSWRPIFPDCPDFQWEIYILNL